MLRRSALRQWRWPRSAGAPAATAQSPSPASPPHHRRLSSAATAEPALPSEANVVVVGGGIIGCSVAYHLAHAGVKDVLLLERDRLTSGTTWHAAGLMVTFGSLSETSTEFRKYTKELYRRGLEEETGQSTGFNPCGFIELATSHDRLEEYRRIAAFNRKCGVAVREIGPMEVRRNNDGVCHVRSGSPSPLEQT